MKVISIVNQKGGVAKTTTALNFSKSLARKGKKILCIDLDSQCNLTHAMGLNKEKIEQKNLTTIDDLLEAEINLEEYSVDEAIYNLEENLYMIPTLDKLSSLDYLMANAINRDTVLDRIVRNVTLNHEFDYIIIDCAPALNLFMVNALVTSDEVIIPLNPSSLSIDGKDRILKLIDTVRKQYNSELKIKGFLFTIVDRKTVFAKNTIKSLKEESKYNVFETQIPRSIQVEKATANKMAVIEMAENSPVAIAYENFTNEYLSI